jgi:hypothetical protein
MKLYSSCYLPLSGPYGGTFAHGAQGCAERGLSSILCRNYPRHLSLASSAVPDNAQDIGTLTINDIAHPCSTYYVLPAEVQMHKHV